MKITSKEYHRFCEKYKEDTSIEIEFLYDESMEKPSSDDYAKNQILKCKCSDKYNCTCPRNECPVWQNIKW